MSHSSILDSLPTPIDFYRQILVWPLELKGLKRNDKGHNPHCAEQLKRINDFDKAWEELKEGFLTSNGWSREQLFSGLVYFHPFVRHFLLPDGTPKIRLFQSRLGVKQLRVKWSGQEPLTLQLERVWLLVFDIEIALLVVESRLEDTDLPQVLELQDRLRRAYPPYWWGKKNTPGHAPTEVILCNAQSKLIGETSNLVDSDRFTQPLIKPDNAEDRYLPVASHWATLLAPLSFEPKEEGRGIYLGHLLDDRMVVMGFVASAKIDQLTAPDWVRLSFSDEKGSSNQFPYSRAFLADWQQRYAYDRFWDSDPDPDANGYPNTGWHTTRLVGCAHTFVYAGKNEGFFRDQVGGAEFHFRYHYLILNLIAQLQYATLLKLSNDMANCIDRLYEPHSNPTKMRQEIEQLTERHRRFTHEYWFLEVSNQEQGKELFAWITGHLKLNELYERVNREQADLHQWLQQQEEERQTQAAEWLNRIAVVGMFVGLLYGLWGAPLVQRGNSDNLLSFGTQWSVSWGDLGWSIAITAGFLIVGAAIYWILSKLLSKATLYWKKRPNGLFRSQQ